YLTMERGDSGGSLSRGPYVRYDPRGRLTMVIRGTLAALALAVGGSAAAGVDETYRAEIQAWRQRREASLKADGGWLSVAGLFWLKEGPNRFGTDPKGDIVLPAGSAPARAGVFDVAGGRTTVTFVKEVEATLRGQPSPRPSCGPTAPARPTSSPWAGSQCT